MSTKCDDCREYKCHGAPGCHCNCHAPRIEVEATQYVPLRTFKIVEGNLTHAMRVSQALVDALQRYGSHSDECNPAKCDCGYDAALKLAEE